MKKIFLVSLALLISTTVYAGQTILYFNSEPGDWVGAGQEKYYTDEDLNFLARRNYDNGISLSMTNFNRPDGQRSIWWYADFAAPFNATLQEGLYENATRFPFQASNAPGLSFSGDGRGCNTLTGRFDIKEIVYNQSTGDVLNFAVDFEQHCEGGESALYGAIRYNSDVPIPTMLPAEIKIENELNPQGCIEATSPEGAYIFLSVEPTQENPLYIYEWSTSTGHTGSSSTMEFPLGLDESTVVFLSTIDPSTGETVSSSLPVCVSDTTAPSITILSPVEGEMFVGNDLFLEVQVNDSVDKNLEKYTVNLGMTNVFVLDADSESSRVKLLQPNLATEPAPTQITVSVQDASGNKANEMVAILLQHNKGAK